jgi:hypothetical protein
LSGRWRTFPASRLHVNDKDLVQFFCHIKNFGE